VLQGAQVTIVNVKNEINMDPFFPRRSICVVTWCDFSHIVFLCVLALAYLGGGSRAMTNEGGQMRYSWGIDTDITR